MMLSPRTNKVLPQSSLIIANKINQKKLVVSTRELLNGHRTFMEDNTDNKVFSNIGQNKPEIRSSKYAQVLKEIL